MSKFGSVGALAKTVFNDVTSVVNKFTLDANNFISEFNTRTETGLSGVLQNLTENLTGDAGAFIQNLVPGGISATEDVSASFFGMPQHYRRIPPSHSSSSETRFVSLTDKFNGATVAELLRGKLKSEIPGVTVTVMANGAKDEMLHQRRRGTNPAGLLASTYPPNKKIRPSDAQDMNRIRREERALKYQMDIKKRAFEEKIKRQVLTSFDKVKNRQEVVSPLNFSKSVKKALPKTKYTEFKMILKSIKEVQKAHKPGFRRSNAATQFLSAMCDLLLPIPGKNELYSFSVFLPMDLVDTYQEIVVKKMCQAS